jgi:hypothetical protein
MARLRDHHRPHRVLEISPCGPVGVAVQVDHHPPVFLDALDLLRMVSHVVLNEVYTPAPTGTDSG